MTSPPDEVWRIDLPWLVPPLLSTDRRHPDDQSRVARSTRLLVRLLAVQAGLPTDLRDVRVALHVAPPLGCEIGTRLVQPSLRCVVGGLREHGLRRIIRQSVIEPAFSAGRAWLIVEAPGADVTSEYPEQIDAPALDDVSDRGVANHRRRST